MCAEPSDRMLMAATRISYQPVVRLVDRKIAYAEILARDEDESGAISGPERIVRAMTHGKRSLSLTAHIIRHTLAEYQTAGIAEQNLALAFNLPLDAMLEPSLIQTIDQLRAEAGLSPRFIRFELTETHPVRDLPTAQNIISGLHGAGYSLALDDVTPNTTNLHSLMAMPLYAIKLDRSVVTHAHNTHFIQTISRMAAQNRQDVIAEGIETPETQALMQSLGVTHGQGYFYARPLSAAALLDYLKD
jgi:EAL domain-containing protein (putative c-di-GMP-specific phosphodiesterase class I)